MRNQLATKSLRWQRLSRLRLQVLELALVLAEAMQSTMAKVPMAKALLAQPPCQADAAMQHPSSEQMATQLCATDAEPQRRHLRSSRWVLLTRRKYFQRVCVVVAMA
eukprot:CAMPEP_0169223470 /NCGR_PEP_ID=MMETSP1016-20121227/22133_1 /TAXON_ID=342587 /ORGANISM="Karlodinium micrum, Strain CCMP2283" /LENGTH=106 /DNA_ID=CAMNT_0009301815 /DNA_START=227 /DNA_END=548 /DNA_ORIENTATION=-